MLGKIRNDVSPPACQLLTIRNAAVGRINYRLVVTRYHHESFDLSGEAFSGEDGGRERSIRAESQRSFLLPWWVTQDGRQGLSLSFRSADMTSDSAISFHWAGPGFKTFLGSAVAGGLASVRSIDMDWLPQSHAFRHYFGLPWEILVIRPHFLSALSCVASPAGWNFFPLEFVILVDCPTSMVPTSLPGERK